MQRRPLATLVAVFAAGAVAGGATVVLVSRPSGPAPARAQDEPAPAHADPRDEMRASVAAMLEEQRRGRKLDAILDELEDRARQQRQVTAVEVQTGLAAIDAVRPDNPEREAAFVRRLENLARRLGQPVAGDEPPPSAASVAALIQGIEAMPAGPERDDRAPAALAAIRRLPLEEQEEAERALAQATRSGVPASPAVPAPDRILSELRQTTDVGARRDLVRRFMEATAGLPVEEQEQLFRELDATTSAR